MHVLPKMPAYVSMGMWLTCHLISISILCHCVLLGTIFTHFVSLMDSFMADPPSFTLIGDTRGGPPVTSTWTRNGEVISDGGSYSMSLAVNEVNRIDVFLPDFEDEILRQSRYRSTLNVTGNLPGVYVYSVINRAMFAPRTASFTIEGIMCRQSLIYSCGRYTAILCSHRQGQSKYKAPKELTAGIGI